MFGCHSEKASRRWLAVDLGGILIGVIGCYLPAVHYAFYCLSVSMVGALFIVVARTRVAFQCATDARITINDFYCRNSHFLCFGKTLSESLREDKCKIRTK